MSEEPESSAQDGDKPGDGRWRKQRYPHPKGCYKIAFGAYGTWFVQVRHKGKRYYLGAVANVNEAVKLRNEFLRSLSPLQTEELPGPQESASGT
jgi:hypothetical protein